MDRKFLLLITALLEGGLLLVSIVLLNYSTVDLWSAVSFSWNATLAALLFSTPMFVGLFVITKSKWSPFCNINKEINEKVLPLFKNCKLLDLALIAIFAGVGEELFFRGWLQSVLINKFSVWSGILIVSLLFGIAHYISTSYATYAFLTGIYFGIIFHVSMNLYIVVLIHAVYDFIALVYLVRKDSECVTFDHTFM